MAITDKEQGVWDIDQVYDKQMQGGIWKYNGAAGEPGGLWQTGPSVYGRLGQNEGGAPTGDSFYSSPVMAPGTYEYGDTSSYGAKSVGADGTLWSWGLNTNGQLGHNDTVNRSIPVQIGTETNWSSSMTTKAQVNTDGKMYMAGPNWNGRLGLNDTVNRSSPTQIGTDTTWATAINSHTFIHSLKTDGTIWAWGYADYGQLGLNQPTAAYSSPVQIPGYTFASLGNSSVPHNSGFAAGITPTGSLYMWGNNRYGQLGLNQGPSKYPWQPYFTRNHHDKSGPNNVSGTTWKLVQNGDASTIATKTDGTLWSWGGNAQGQLGLNTPGPQGFSSPVQVGTDTTWTGAISYSTQYGQLSSAIKTDGTTWAWGRAGLLLNQPNTQGYSSPIQIPGNYTTLGNGAAINLIKPG